jgi:peptide/nickel transport system permease protein
MATRGRKWDFVWRRLLQTVPVIVFATFVVFALLKLVPGDIALTLAGDNATEQRIAEIRQLYGLDRPFLVQYGSWLWKAVHGNLSVSLLSGESVLDAILRSLPNTLLIVAIALLLAVLAGIPLGVLAASRPGSWLDRGLMTLSSLGVAVPNFWLAMILVTVIALLANRLLAATVVVEAVFAIPGMGSLIVHGAVHRDFPVVQGVVFTMVLIVIVINFTADALYRVVDPRVSS